MARLFIIMLSVSLYSCTSQHFTQVDIYFGQFKLDGTVVTEAEWQSFVEKYVSRVFKDGSTIIKTSGNWFDTSRHQLITEPSYVIVSVSKMTPQLSRQIDSVRYWYKKLYNQQSVLRVDKKVKANLLQ